LIEPKKIRIDKNNNILILDEGNHKLLKFDRNGKLDKEIGIIGQATGELLYPMDFFIYNNEEIYILDKGNNRIQIFDLDGNKIHIVKSRLFRMVLPTTNFYINSRKNIYLNIPDLGFLFTVLDFNGKIINQFGKLIKGKLLENHVDFVIDNEDNIFVSFKSKGIIRKYDINGNLLFNTTINCKELMLVRKQIEKLPKRMGVYWQTKHLFILNNKLFFQVGGINRPLIEMNLKGEVIRSIYFYHKKNLLTSGNIALRENNIYMLNNNNKIFVYNILRNERR